MLVDQFGRIHNYLRISLTDRCNLRCTYCMPENTMFMPNDKLLQAPEIFQITKVFKSLGIHKIKLTGGEPLVRQDFKEIVEQLALLKLEMGITTNGYLLHEHFETLKRNEIYSINISLDSLNPEKFKSITQRNYFHGVIKNIETALTLGFKVKLNAVLIQGFNTEEVDAFVQLLKAHPLHVRFIEFMPFKGNKWQQASSFTHNNVLQHLKTNYKIAKLNDPVNSTSTNYALKGHLGSVGLISTMSHSFCETCNRLRLTADGKLKNCLLGSDEFDLREALRKGEALHPIVEQAMKSKHKEHGGIPSFKALPKEFQYQNRSMVAIGG